MAAAKGIGSIIEQQILKRAANMLSEVGVDLAAAAKNTKRGKLSPSDFRKLFSENNLRMTFDDSSWPEQLGRLGIRYIPDFDYWGDLQQVLDPKLSPVARDVLLNNQRVVMNLHTNPELNSVLGRDLLVDPQSARNWYPTLSGHMKEKWGIPLVRSAQLRGKLSGGTAFPVETAAAKQLITNPTRMFDVPNMNTENAVARLIEPADYIDDPEAWGGLGEHAKTYNYAMNYVSPLDPRFVTNDIHQVALSTGLAKGAGVSPDAIFQNKGLYKMWTSITKQLADETGMRPNEAQALMWSVWRDLMSGDVSGVPATEKLLTPAKETLDALQGNPKGILNAMARSARSRQKTQMAAAKSLATEAKQKEALASAIARGDRRFAAAKELADKHGVKLDSRLRALALLAGGLGALGFAKGGDDQTNLDALGRML